jgi:hypothetical protein
MKLNAFAGIAMDLSCTLRVDGRGYSDAARQLVTLLIYEQTPQVSLMA